MYRLRRRGARKVMSYKVRRLVTLAVLAGVFLLVVIKSH